MFSCVFFSILELSLRPLNYELLKVPCLGILPIRSVRWKSNNWESEGLNSCPGSATNRHSFTCLGLKWDMASILQVIWVYTSTWTMPVLTGRGSMIPWGASCGRSRIAGQVNLISFSKYFFWSVILSFPIKVLEHSLSRFFSHEDHLFVYLEIVYYASS